jgi:hypothetical protein
MFKATMSNGGRAVFSSTLEGHLTKHIVKGSNLAVRYGKLETL